MTMQTSSLPPRALTVAGSDSGGGAGIQADLKTFAALSAYGMSVLTALTAQNTLGVQSVHAVPTDFITAQWTSVTSDLGVDALKTGMLASADVIHVVSKSLAAARSSTWITVDPVMVATSGDPLLAPDATRALVTELVPVADIITPNLPEAERMLAVAAGGNPEVHKIGSIQDMIQAARKLGKLGGAKYVLVKGGHLPLDRATLAPVSDADTSNDSVCMDVLLDVAADQVTQFCVPRIRTSSTHGTGCTLSAAITAVLARTPKASVPEAKQGDVVREAVRKAIAFTHRAIQAACEALGKGHGPLNHGFATHMSALEAGDVDVPEQEMVTASGGAPTGDLNKNGKDEQAGKVLALTGIGWRREASILSTPRSFLALLKNACSQEWHDYTNHRFVLGMGNGTLPVASFKHYLQQDYLFLTHFARCNALAAYKAHTMADVLFSAEIICHIGRESQLHIDYCAEWGIAKADLMQLPEARANMAYTRFTLDRGMSGDLLDLRAALAPCLFGYGEIAVNLNGSAATVKDHAQNPYWKWIENYAADDYQQACREGEVLIERLAIEYGVWHAPKRVEVLVDTFRKATLLEIGFWDMGWHIEW
ncbi:Phosphomethylpyrimidine kinase-domain-containing protein [Catenaria anguillulae PL171]|uniref:Phosphomethylpyrimidine kinase-domain-containing protein n=1 Tax=Catenaria anguillulae PL171 TaxID=765915 RepID=A0A1Y2I0C2_9FUNG|nr:Phosphomethylpyrimidine kinase-domain-containing protein [Catenaria anguillulae PL171]